jgi:tRNA pseudouridine38-40 synthase
MPDGWSARFKAQARRYVYLLHTSREPDALRARYYGFEPRELDLGAMQLASQVLLGRHDFRSFCGVPPTNGTERTVTHVSVGRLNARTIRFELRADGFLHRMVRVTVGTLIEIGRGQRDVVSMAELIAARDRRQAGHTALAAGLYLAGVRYADFDSFCEPQA